MESSQEPTESPKASVEVREDESTELLSETDQDTSAGRDHSQRAQTLSSQAMASNTWRQHESFEQTVSTENEQIASDESRHRRHSQESLVQPERNTGIGWHGSTDQLIEMEDQASDSSGHPPQSTNTHHSVSQWPRKKKRQGWRYGVFCAAAATCTVLVINVVFAVVTAAVLRGKPERWESGSAILLEGSSKQVHAWSIALHLVINSFGSVVLGGSNYTMQCLAAPSREEVDHAHERGKALDIGTQSIRNVFGRIAWKRSAAWWVLAISSVPMHLLYNSTVFQTVNDNFYSVVIARQNFLAGEPFLNDLAAWDHSHGYSNYSRFNQSNVYTGLRELQQFFAKNSGNDDMVKVAQPSDCVRAYTGQLISEYSDVLLLTETTNSGNGSFLALEVSHKSNTEWMRDDYFATDKNSSNWSSSKLLTQLDNGKAWNMTISQANVQVDHCLLRKTDRTKLQLCVPFLAIVVVCNLLKSAVMLWTGCGLQSDPLVTVGDALSSLLQDPSSRIVAELDYFGSALDEKRKIWGRSLSDAVRGLWFSSSSATSWIVTLSFCLAGIIAGSILLDIGVSNYHLPSRAAAFAQGFGSYNSNMVLFSSDNPHLPTAGVAGVISTLLVANSPQVICSFLYFMYNSLLSTILLGSEWNSYFLTKKTLRVSDPRGVQRSTYWLQLPYRYAVPLIIASSLLHWFISQSIFLMRIQIYDVTEKYGSPYNIYSEFLDFTPTSSIGYSCPPILAAILLGAVMLVVLIGLGFRKLNPQMPVVRSHSLAVAAQCCRPDDDVEAAFLPVSWGEVSDEPGRLCFTSKDVHAPGQQMTETI